MIVSYTHLDVYKRQVVTLLPERVVDNREDLFDIALPIAAHGKGHGLIKHGNTSDTANVTTKGWNTALAYMIQHRVSEFKEKIVNAVEKEADLSR